MDTQLDGTATRWKDREARAGQEVTALKEERKKQEKGHESVLD